VKECLFKQPNRTPSLATKAPVPLEVGCSALARIVPLNEKEKYCKEKGALFGDAPLLELRQDNAVVQL
jgi:hypothetical protein